MSGLKVFNLADPSVFNEQSGVETDMAAIGGFDITPSDSVNLDRPFRSLYIGHATAGDVSVQTIDDSTVIFKNAQPGQIIPIQGKRVNATGTGLTNLRGLY